MLICPIIVAFIFSTSRMENTVECSEHFLLLMQGRTCVLFTSSWEWFLTYNRWNDICQLKGWICYFPVALIPWQKLLREGTVYFGFQFEAAVHDGGGRQDGRILRQLPTASLAGEVEVDECSCWALRSWCRPHWKADLPTFSEPTLASPHRGLPRLTWSRSVPGGLSPDDSASCQRQSILTSHNLKKKSAPIFTLGNYITKCLIKRTGKDCREWIRYWRRYFIC